MWICIKCYWLIIRLSLCRHMNVREKINFYCSKTLHQNKRTWCVSVWKHAANETNTNCYTSGSLYVIYPLHCLIKPFICSCRLIFVISALQSPKTPCWPEVLWKSPAQGSGGPRINNNNNNRPLLSIITWSVRSEEHLGGWGGGGAG